MIISITGTPGTGKTTVSKIIAKKLNAKIILLNSFIKSNRLYEGRDRKRKAIIVNPKKVKLVLKKELKKYTKTHHIIVEGHLSHLIETDIIFVLRLSPDKLEKRLRNKGFSKSKITENIQAEILDVIYSEALESQRKVVQINSTSKSPSRVAERILNTLRSKKYKSDKVDWTAKFHGYLK